MTRSNHNRLQITAGGEDVLFGAELSDGQVDNILSELQRAMPERARLLMAGTDPFGKHFTTLNLS